MFHISALFGVNCLRIADNVTKRVFSADCADYQDNFNAYSHGHDSAPQKPICE